MGNDLEKQYNLKEKPVKLPGSYCFLKFVDHPTDPSSSLIIVKEPHKAGIISSQILLPIKEVKALGYSEYTVATCKRCRPLSLVKPRSQAEMKLIIREIIKLSCEIGRIFVCDGRLMLWCEQIRSQWLRSPEQIEQGRQSDKSKVFWAGICLINYLHCVYEKETDKKRRDKKQEIEAFFDPKDKGQYYDFLDNLEFRLSRSSFWSSISEGMKNLITVMLAKEQNSRIDLSTLVLLPYFATEKQLRLYHMISDQMLEWDQKQSIIAMETLQIVIKDKVIFDELVLNDYLMPVLIFLLEKKPETIISAVIELPSPPAHVIVACVKKAQPKNWRLWSCILMKIGRFHSIMSEEQYAAVASRAAFCSFELSFLHDKLIRVIPTLLRTIKEPNYRKEIEFQLLTNVIENRNIEKSILLLGLKCVIEMLNCNLITNVNKLFGVRFDPAKYQQQLEINIHILELYRLMILAMEPVQLVSVMMPKLDPYLSMEDLSDELFFFAKRCVSLAMEILTKARNIAEGDQFEIKYEGSLFALGEIPRPSPSELVVVLRKQACKSKNPNISWLTEILDQQQPLTQI